MSNPPNAKLALPRDAAPATASPAKAQPGDTLPNPRKLREKVVMMLISTSSTAIQPGQAGRADALIEEAEKIISYIMGGEAA